MDVSNPSALASSLAAISAHVGMADPTVQSAVCDAVQNLCTARGWGEVQVEGPVHNVVTLSAPPVTLAWLRADVDVIRDMIVSIAGTECGQVQFRRL